MAPLETFPLRHVRLGRGRCGGGEGVLGSGMGDMGGGYWLRVVAMGGFRGQWA